MAKEPSYNQTNFSEDRPLYEDEISRPVPESEIPEINPAEEPKPWYKNKKILAVIGIIVFAFILLIVFIAANQRSDAPPEITLEEGEQVMENNDPFLRRINLLSKELEEADPTKPSLIFPPVNMDIRLDEE